MVADWCWPCWGRVSTRSGGSRAASACPRAACSRGRGCPGARASPAPAAAPPTSRPGLTGSQGCHIQRCFTSKLVSHIKMCQRRMCPVSVCPPGHQLGGGVCVNWLSSRYLQHLLTLRHPDFLSLLHEICHAEVAAWRIIIHICGQGNIRPNIQREINDRKEHL